MERDGKHVTRSASIQDGCVCRARIDESTHDDNALEDGGDVKRTEAVDPRHVDVSARGEKSLNNLDVAEVACGKKWGHAAGPRRIRRNSMRENDSDNLHVADAARNKEGRRSNSILRTRGCSVVE
jgi:hypothetical protein